MQPLVFTGTFSHLLSRAKRTADSREFIARTLPFASLDAQGRQALVDQVALLRECKQPGLLRLQDKAVDKAGQRITLLFQLPLADCRGIMDWEPSSFNEDKLWEVVVQIVALLADLQKTLQGRPANCLYPGNLLLCNNVLKMACFGSALLVPEDFSCYEHFLAPQLKSREQGGPKSDVWALGQLLHSLFLTLRLPPSPEMARVIRWCTSRPPKERPSLDDLLGVPDISLRIRERRLRQNGALLQRREEELLKRERFLQAGRQGKQ